MSKLSPDSELLYAACLNRGREGDATTPKHFFQDDLNNILKCGPLELLGVVQELVDHQLFRTMRLSGVTCWTTRPKNLAKRYEMAAVGELTGRC